MATGLRQEKLYFKFNLVMSFSCWRLYIYIYTYIYILYIYIQTLYILFTNLLSTSIHGYQEIKPRQEQEIRISRITAQGKKKKKYHRTKKTKQKKTKKNENANSVTPVEKNLEICSQLVKRIIKPTVKCRNATITRVLNTSRANYKINLNRESEFSY